MEIWRDIPNFEGRYQVSNYGRVKSLNFYSNATKKYYDRELILKPHTVRGYHRVVLCKNGKHINYSVHRLVAEVFLDNPNNKPCVNHKDGNKLNNCADNLEFCTYSENEKHSHDVLGKQPINKKKIEQYDLQGNFIRQWESLAEIGRYFKCNYTNFTRCCCGKGKSAKGFVWKYVKEVV